MKIKILLVLLVGAVMADGRGEVRDAAGYAKSCTVERDEFKKSVHVSSPVAGNQTRFDYIGLHKLSGAGDQYFVLFCTRRAAEDGVAAWASMIDGKGREFTLSEVNSSVSPTGSFVEKRTAVLSREYLESIKASGVRCRIYGKAGVTEDWELVADFIEGFLMACDSVK